MISICKCKIYMCILIGTFTPCCWCHVHLEKRSGFRVPAYQHTRGDIEIKKSNHWESSSVCVCSVTSLVLLQWCLKLCNPMDYSLPVFSVHGILEARILEWIACPSSGDLPIPGIKPTSPLSPALQVDSLPTEPSGKLKQRLFQVNFCCVVCGMVLFPSEYFGAGNLPGNLHHNIFKCLEW